MRRQYTFVQYYLTAAVTTAVLLLALASAPAAHAADVETQASDVESRPKLGEQAIGEGTGFPIALGSFNGLEIRVDADEDGELDLVRRKYPSNAKSLGNNEFWRDNITVGTTKYFFITKETVNMKSTFTHSDLPANLTSRGEVVSSGTSHQDLRKRATNPIYLSLTTCDKPDSNHSSPGSFPQLEFYYSTSEKLTEPGPGKDSNYQNVATAVGGYVSLQLDTENDIFIGIAAPNSSVWTGKYGFEIAASVDDYFHSVDFNDPMLWFIDADQSTALLVTNNMTQSARGSENYQQWMNVTPPYTMFAHDINNTALVGLERSYCALNDLSQVGRISNSTEVGMTSRGLGNKPKEQFYLTGLSAKSTYNGILAMDGNGTKSGNGIVNGGGKVYKSMNFTTKADDNCAVLFNLTFCSEVAYAVPSHPGMNVSTLRDIYDDYAQKYMRNFDKSLQQVQCNTSKESMFSLAVNCEDCEKAYRQWLCSVTIPRCADFSNNAPYLQVRNAGQDFINGSSLPANSSYRKHKATNNSRNHLIDEKIKPGPYKEILPCKDICYDLVKKCPSSLGFGCPEGKWMNSSYGYRDPNGDITCSYLGAAYYLNVAAKMGVWASVYMLMAMWGFWWAIW
ncbi:hypothetical protein N7532_007410 [Penicillium argentinense]|uniref:Uncharacterized protein n=1 Tax=Penicillium argentinense TaxID=1131581 RepID=A0A9W9F7W2_9EURO|nr:uncharacterized protein N7532_007410 [Penicillium argentinense]KAJ5095119.1 hypothetical protein N7532_007410 [Penicillium argentinense]